MKKTLYRIFRSKAAYLIILMVMAAGVVTAQTDTTKTDVPQEKSKEHKKKKRDHFIPYAGVSFNHFVSDADRYKSVLAPGYMLGFDYQRGRFFYWQIGLRYNNAVYLLEDLTVPKDSANYDDIFGVRDFDLPITVGINLLSFTDRIVALRIFISAIPSYTLNIGDNQLGLTEEDINTFNLYGRLGAALDVAFLEISVGYNLGFMDLLSDYPSKPGQAYLTLGFRF